MGFGDLSIEHAPRAAKNFQTARQFVQRNHDRDTFFRLASRCDEWHGDCIAAHSDYHAVMTSIFQPMDAHTPRTPHTPVKEPLEPDAPGGPIDPDDGEPDDPVETPERPRPPGKHA